MNTTLFCPGPTHTEFLQNAFTGNHGEKYNISTRPTDNRMTSQRCAVLMAISIANKCKMNYVGPFPSIPFMYISCYYPNLSKVYVLLLLSVQCWFWLLILFQFCLQHSVFPWKIRIIEISWRKYSTTSSSSPWKIN